MFRRTLCLVLTATIAGIPSGHDPAWATEKQPDLSERVKTQVAKLGVGEKAMVRVQLHDRNQLEGYVSQVHEDSFSITDPKSSEVRTVTYSDVKRLHEKGLSTSSAEAVRRRSLSLRATDAVVVGCAAFWRTDSNRIPGVPEKQRTARLLSLHLQSLDGTLMKRLLDLTFRCSKSHAEFATTRSTSSSRRPARPS
jgi:hypothetical protein